MKTTNKILVVDLEATCWEQDGEYQKLHSEIIEIGICELDIHSGEISKKRGILVIPEHSTISQFCTDLTSITSEMIDQEGISFEEAVQVLHDEYNSSQYTWASYGAYDRNKFREQCQQRQVEYPFGNQHLNVKNVFRDVAGLRRAMGMKRALQHLKFPLTGTHHRGVDDAYNIAKILYWCLQKR